MDPKTTALVLVGYQNDYFASDGILRGVVENQGRVDTVLKNTVAFIDSIASLEVAVFATPFFHDPNYRDQAATVGILHSIKESGAFRLGTTGAQTIPELLAMADRVTYLEGKCGFNAFATTTLDAALKARGIKDVLVAGMITSLCIDSTARAAYELGYTVSILSDCTSGRTDTEQEFYCDKVFPLYGRVVNSPVLTAELRAG